MNWDEVPSFVEGAIAADRQQIIKMIQSIVDETESYGEAMTDFMRGINSMGKTVIQFIETKS